MKRIIKNSNENLSFTKILSFIQNLKSILKVNSTMTLNPTLTINPTASFKRMIPLKLSTTLPLNSMLKLFFTIFIFNATINLTTAANNPEKIYKPIIIGDLSTAPNLNDLLSFDVQNEAGDSFPEGTTYLWKITLDSKFGNYTNQSINFRWKWPTQGILSCNVTFPNNTNTIATRQIVPARVAAFNAQISITGNDYFYPNNIIVAPNKTVSYRTIHSIQCIKNPNYPNKIAVGISSHNSDSDGVMSKIELSNITLTNNNPINEIHRCSVDKKEIYAKEDREIVTNATTACKGVSLEYKESISGKYSISK